MIFRFLDERYRFVDDEDRQRYVRLFEEDAVASSWRFVSYGLMSNHGHCGALVGSETLKEVFHRAHSRFGRRWHRRHGGLGPVFADRPANHQVRSHRMAELIAYNHMDPVRNGLVSKPAESTWTSHRAYLRLTPAPRWLDVPFGLDLCGFDDREADRRRFDDFVRSCQRRHWQWDPDELHQATGSALEPACQPLRPDHDRARPSCERIMQEVAARIGLPAEALNRPSRRPSNDISRARCAVAVAAIIHIGHPRSEVARALRVSPQAVGKMLAKQQGRDLAAMLSARLVRNS